MENFKPYYAVIFTSKVTENNEGYAEMAQQICDSSPAARDCWSSS